MTSVAKKDATCEVPGNIAYYVCDKCGTYYSDAEATHVISKETVVIPAKGHTLEKVEKVDATCTSVGCKEYWKCTNNGCGKIFADKDGKTETTLFDLAIAAKGHAWNTEYTVDVEPTTETEGSKSIHCSICNEIKEGSVVTIPKIEVAKPISTPTASPIGTPEVTPTVSPSVEPSGKPSEAVYKPVKVTIVSVKNNKKKTITIKIKAAKNAKKYKVQYATDKKFKKLKTITTKKLTITLKKLKKKKIYYIRICGVNGKQVGPWSNVKKVKMNK